MQGPQAAWLQTEPVYPHLEYDGGEHTCRAIRGGDLHGVWGHVGCVGAPVFAGAGERDAFLVAGKLDELAQLLLGEHLQCSPEELDVLVCLHQPHLVHGVGLGRKGPRREQAQAPNPAPPQSGVGSVREMMATGHREGMTVPATTG